MPLMICYGLVVSGTAWAKELNVAYGEVKAKSCLFCKQKSQQGANFCWNCGHELSLAPGMVGVKDLVEITIRKKGKPPSPLVIIPEKEHLFIGHVLGTSDGWAAMANKGFSHWVQFGNVISNYVGKDDLGLFALNTSQ